MVLTHLLFLLPLLQQPGAGPAPGEVGKFFWPPAASKTLRYQASFSKERKLPKDVQKAEKAARKAGGLYYPGRPPKQRVEMKMDIELEVGPGRIKGTYSTSLGKQSLRMKVRRPKRGKSADAAMESGAAVPFLSNSRIGYVWGLPSSKGEELSEFPLAAFERRFDYTFTKAAKKGSVPANLNGQFGDHLLPVLWVYPLPCWIGDLVHTLDLGGEAVIEGKRLIAEGTQQVALGYRNTRAELLWTQASSGGFSMTYDIKVEQLMSKRRSGQGLMNRTGYWLFDIKGKATYSFSAQAWEAIEEKVTARPKALDDTTMRNLRDQVFAGEIKILRTKASSKKKVRRRRRR